MIFMWITYLIAFILSAAIDLITSPGLNWSYWVWAGLGIGFAISTVNLILTHKTCPKCGKMLDMDDAYCGRCGHKSGQVGKK